MKLVRIIEAVLHRVSTDARIAAAYVFGIVATAIVGFIMNWSER